MIEQQLNVEIEDGHEVSWAENFRMVDIEINPWSPGFTKPEIRVIRIRYPRKKFKMNQSACLV